MDEGGLWQCSIAFSLRRVEIKTLSETRAPGSVRSASSYWTWGVLLLILLGVAAIRIRLLNQPLERDEGEYAYAGQLLLDRIPPYLLAYNMKLPGTYFTYAGIMGLFGQTIAGIHLGFLLVNAAT